MGNVGKGMLIALIILYVLSPMDFVPGPIDDIIASLIGIAAVQKLGSHKHDQDYYDDGHDQDYYDNEQ